MLPENIHSCLHIVLVKSSPVPCCVFMTEDPNEATTSQSIPARHKGEGGLQSGGEEVNVEARKGRGDKGEGKRGIWRGERTKEHVKGKAKRE